MLSPLCVSHSRHAATHERQPMQREGSRKMRFTAIVYSSLAQGRLGLRAGAWQFTATLTRGGQQIWVYLVGPVGWLRSGRDGDGADLVLRYLHHWLKHRIGQDVRRLGVAVVIWDEDGIRADRADDQRGNRHLATPCARRHPVAIGDAQPCGGLLVYLNPGIRRLFEQERRATCLISRQVMVDHTPCRQHQWVLFVRLLGGW